MLSVLTDGTSDWILEFSRNDRPFLAWRYPDRESAVAEADERLHELVRAGWTSHW